MILGITSLGEGRTRIGTRLQLWVVHLAGGVVGGAGMAMIVVLGSAPFRTFLPYDARVALCALIVATLLLVDLRLIRAQSRRKQVPATWTTRYGPTPAYFLYGALLGSGLATYVPYAITYGIFALVLFTLPLGFALIAGSLFGLGRAVGLAFGLLPAARIDGVSRVLYQRPGAQRTASYFSAMMLLGVFGILVSSAFV